LSGLHLNILPIKPVLDGHELIKADQSTNVECEALPRQIICSPLCPNLLPNGLNVFRRAGCS
jgi:hypothetical protein